MEITRICKLQEIWNEKVHNWYFAVHARMFSPDGKKFRRFKFVIWFDSEDLFEFYAEQKSVSKKEIRNYASEIACATIPWDLKWKDRQTFVDFCAQNIRKYNEGFGV